MPSFKKRLIVEQFQGNYLNSSHAHLFTAFCTIRHVVKSGADNLVTRPLSTFQKGHHFENRRREGPGEEVVVLILNTSWERFGLAALVDGKAECLRFCPPIYFLSVKCKRCTR